MWNNVEEFRVWWWETAGKPLRPPFENPIFFTDNAMSLCLYREGRFQVELYIIAPNGSSPAHTHPGVDSSFMHLTGNLKFNLANRDNSLYVPPSLPKEDGTHPWFNAGAALSPDGTPHWLWVGPEGASFLSFEHWKEADPSSVTVNWEGDPVGEQHKTMLESLK